MLSTIGRFLVAYWSFSLDDVIMAKITWNHFTDLSQTGAHHKFFCCFFNILEKRNESWFCCSALYSLVLAHIYDLFPSFTKAHSFILYWATIAPHLLSSRCQTGFNASGLSGGSSFRMQLQKIRQLWLILPRYISSEDFELSATLRVKEVDVRNAPIRKSTANQQRLVGKKNRFLTWLGSADLAPRSTSSPSSLSCGQTASVIRRAFHPPPCQ